MCGILGLTAHKEVIQDLYDGLIVLQHRGQDAAGITTYDGARFNLKKGDGLVREVFSIKNMVRLKGTSGLAHVRYPTAGIYESSEAQPFYVNSPFGISLVHNGNLTNYAELKKEVLENNIRHLNTASDSEVLLNVVADEILKLKTLKLTPAKLFKAMTGVFKRVRGGYAAIALIAGQGMIGFRDPHAIRPLIYGQRKNGQHDEYIFASESVALDTLGFKILADVKPGEVVFIDTEGKLHKKVCAPKTSWHPCIFEYVYLARPDSVIDGISVYKSRSRMGEHLGKQVEKAHLEIDSVIPVPDTSRSAALALSHKIKVKYREGLVKNRYIGRTFIMPGQKIRQKSIRQKLNPIGLEFRRRHILLVDDSIVRGNTSRQIVELARAAGAAKVYFASCAPALKWPCLYGVDLPSKSEFVAHNLNTEEVSKMISSDHLFYQTLPDLISAVKADNPKIKNFCVACMDGKYPTGDVTEKVLAKAESDRKQAKEQMEKGDTSEKKQQQLNLSF